MLTEFACWEVDYYTTPLAEEEKEKSTTGAEQVAYADEVPPGILKHIRAVRNYELTKRRKSLAGYSSATTYEYTLIRKKRPKSYTGPDLRFKAFMEVEYTDDWKKYPGVLYEDIGIPVCENNIFSGIPGGIRFVCYTDETPMEFMPLIKKFPNVEFRTKLIK